MAAHAEVVEGVFAFAEPFWGRRDLRAAWPHTDPDLRRCWAQQWLTPVRERVRRDGFRPGEVVEAFAEDEPDHPLFPVFEELQMPRLLGAGPVHTWGTTFGHRLVAPDVELVHLMPVPDDGSVRVLRPGEAFVGMPFLMSLREGRWRVLNFFSERLPEPGWPPVLA